MASTRPPLRHVLVRWPLAILLAAIPAAPLTALTPTSSNGDSGAEPALSAAAATQSEPPPPAPLPDKGMEIYGFAMVDTIYDFKQVNPDWFDVLRPTQLPAFPDEFGQNGNFWASVRQSQLGVKGWIPTSLGVLDARFEFDLFGVGSDAGQTTFHLRHAYGSLGQFLAGQTNSVFSDGGVSPRAIDYWGPNGMAAFRNIQLRWMPMQGQNELFFALERPGASADTNSVLGDRVEIANVKPHFPAPDFTAHYRRTGDWGYVQLAGLVRYMAWTDTLDDDFDLSGHAVGWGVMGSTNVKLGDVGTIKASVMYGEGDENYMNDAPVDVGLQTNIGEGNPHRPVTGKALPALGAVAFFDWNWSDHYSSAVGYSLVDIDNSDLQTPEAFHRGHYALANFLAYPVKNLMTGLQFMWGRRQNFRDGFSVDDYRIQFSARYEFSFVLGAPR